MSLYESFAYIPNVNFCAQCPMPTQTNICNVFISMKNYKKLMLFTNLFSKNSDFFVSMFRTIQNASSWPERWSQEAHMFYATLFLWNTLLSILNYYNLGSAYLFMLMVAFPLLGRVFIWEVCLEKSRRTTICSNGNVFVAMYLLSVAIPLMLWSYMFWMLLDFVIPIFGRTGSNEPPEVPISLFVTFFILVFLSYSVS